MELRLLLGSYLLGWAVAAPIGPVNLEIMRRTLRHGTGAGLMVGVGAVIIDGIFLLSFSTGMAHIESLAGLRRPLLFVGGAFLLVLAVGALREALHPPKLSPAAANGEATAEAPSAPPPPWWRNLGLGLAMTTSNPYTFAFWSAFALQFAPLPLAERLACCAAMMAGCFSWVLTITLAMRTARRWVSPRSFAIATAVGAACLLYFGARFLWEGVAGG